MNKRKWTKKEIEEFRKEHGNIFYYNKKDSNFLVPKVYGLGLSPNWANPVIWILIIAIILFFIISTFLH